MVVESLKSEERIDLFKYMKNEDKPGGNDEFWWAGEQLEALRFYLEDNVLILAEYQEDDYQGECFAIIMIDNIYIIWRDSFGSCSGCDSLEGGNGYKYIKETLTEGNTLQFCSLEDARKYVVEERNQEKYQEWKYMPLNLFDKAKKISEEIR